MAEEVNTRLQTKTKSKNKNRWLIYIICAAIGVTLGYFLAKPSTPKYIEAPTKTYHSSSADKQG